MSSFDDITDGSDNKFIRHSPHMLKQLFGADDVMPFWVADMDFVVAEPITQELKRIADRGVYAYEFDAENVYRAIANWYQARHALSLNTPSLVQVPGVLAGIALLIRELTQPEDGIIIQTPVYHQFFKIIKTANRKMISNPLQITEGRYAMDFVDLENKLKPGQVKAMILCNPHNPVGRVWRPDELKQLVELADQYDVTIISDEIHSDIVYSGHAFNSMMSIAPGRHIALLGSAKTFGMQSIANGYIYTENEALLEKIKAVVDAMYLSHGNAFTTFGTIAAFKHGGLWLDELLAYLEKTIAWVDDYLHAELPMVKMFPVEGTYQVWLDFRETGWSEKELNQLLVEKAKLGLTPGSWFGKEGRLFMRMNIASPLSKIQQAFKQLKEAIV